MRTLMERWISRVTYIQKYFFRTFFIILLGDVLEIMEQRHDWATFNFTPELFKYVLTRMIPEVIMPSKSQDEEQVRDHYDRESYDLSHQ